MTLYHVVYSHHRAYSLVSYIVNCYVQACAFSSGLLRSAPSAISVEFPCPQQVHQQQHRQYVREPYLVITMMNAESKLPTKALGMARQSLRDEVHAGVQALKWPSLLPRIWALSGEVDAIRAAGAEVASGRNSGFAEDMLGGTKLKILQWNILCDGLSGSHPERGGFVKAPPDSLDWDKRRWKILEEILRWDCDVLALQEVDHHHDWLSPMLQKGGYRGLFVKKPCAPGLESNPTLEDGCSLFYRATPGAGAGAGKGEGEKESSTTLELLDAHSFTFAVIEGEDMVDDGEEEIEAGDKAADVTDSRTPVVQNQVAMLALLRVSAGQGTEGADQNVDARQDSLVLLATTHLKALKNGHGEQARARQASQLLAEVDRFRVGHEAGRGLPPGSIPLVVAGDFNATPHMSKSGGGDGSGYEPLCFQRIMNHPLRLRSAFPLEGMFTTWKVRPLAAAAAPPAADLAAATDTPAQQAKGSAAEGGRTKETKHCIDYVWVSEGVQTVRRSTFPRGEELGPLRAPSFVYPSDHFALAAELRLP